MTDTQARAGVIVASTPCAEGPKALPLDGCSSLGTCGARAPHFDAWARVFDGDIVGGGVAHLAIDTSSDAVCGVERPLAGWYGTGSQDEYDFAAALPTCAQCADGREP